MSSSYTITFNQQRGVTTMIISLIILTLITMVSLMVSYTISVEQKISGNELRSRQAFDAAEAGIRAALNYVENKNGGPDRDDNGAPDNVFYDNAGVLTNPVLTPADTTGDTNEYNITDASTGNYHGRVTVSVTDVSPSADMTNLLLSAVGRSADDVASRTISLMVHNIEPMSKVPDVPMIGMGAISIRRVRIYNPEGNTTIWGGSNIEFTGTRAGTYIPPVGGSCLTDASSCSPASSLSAGITADILDNDESLAALSADEFFYNTFGMSLETWRTMVADVEVDAANYENDWDAGSPGVNKAEGKFIYVDASSADADDQDAGTFAFGCSTANLDTGNDREDRCGTGNADAEPGVIVVDGNLTLTDGGYYMGLIYVTGNVTMVDDTEIQGTLIVGGTLTQSSGNDMDMYYDSTLLSTIQQNGLKSGAAGTWRDFD